MTGCRDPRAGSWELGAGSWELGAGSRELGAGSWELRAGSRELGAGSRESGAGSCSLSFQRRTDSETELLAPSVLVERCEPARGATRASSGFHPPPPFHPLPFLSAHRPARRRLPRLLASASASVSWQGRGGIGDARFIDGAADTSPPWSQARHPPRDNLEKIPTFFQLLAVSRSVSRSLSKRSGGGAGAEALSTTGTSSSDPERRTPMWQRG